jgi:methyltransferase-like protein
LDFLAQSAPGEDNPYGILLKKELNLLRDKDDSYLLHEHLEEHNAPVYFHQFMERAEAEGLQYLGEADFSVMSIRNFPPQVESMLQNVSSNLVQTEQYMDFVRNRMFRQTLLCHRDVKLDRSLAPDRVLTLHVASWVKPEPAEVDLQARTQTVFRGPSGVTTTTEPLVKAALLQLSENWPRSVPFVELLAQARSRLNPEPVVVDTAGVTQDARRLADTLLRCYATTQVELSVRSSPFTTAISPRPLASRVARHMAESGNTVTNLRHETAHLNDLQRHVLRHLDGKRDQAALLDALCDVVSSGGLVVHERGQAVADRQRVREILEQSLSAALSQLARMTLLLNRAS